MMLALMAPRRSVVLTHVVAAAILPDGSRQAGGCDLQNGSRALLSYVVPLFLLNRDFEENTGGIRLERQPA